MNELLRKDLSEGTKPARYGWIIDTDHLHIPDQEPAEKSDAGRRGPQNISQAINDRLLAGEGRKFKMRDDDGELYYTGRIIMEDPGDEGTELDFRPLDDFGKGWAGATEILYFDEDRTQWLVL